MDEVQGVKRLPLSHVKGRPERRCRFQTTGFYLVSAEDMDRLRRKRVRSPEETIVDIELPVRVSLKRFRGYKRPAGGTRSMRREKRH